MGFISVRNWRKFQHYDPTKRVPPWIKNHTELMADDNYLALTWVQRGVLHGIWMEYSTARCQLPDSTLSLTRRLGGKVTRATLEALNHAGFIDFVASAALAEGYQDASSRARSPELEVEVETPYPFEDEPKNPRGNGTNQRAQGTNPRVGKQVKLVETFIRNGGYQLTDESLRDEIRQHGINGDQESMLVELAHGIRHADTDL